jgi:hypothetical protein
MIVDNQEGYVSFIYLKQIRGGGCGFGGKREDLEYLMEEGLLVRLHRGSTRETSERSFSGECVT